MKKIYFTLALIFALHSPLIADANSSLLPGIYEEITREQPTGCGRFMKVAVQPEGHPNPGVWLASSEDPKNFPPPSRQFEARPFRFRLTEDVSMFSRDGTRISDRAAFEYKRGLLVPLLFMPFRESLTLKVSRFNKDRLIFRNRARALWLIPIPSEDNWTSKYKRLDPSDPRLK